MAIKNIEVIKNGVATTLNDFYFEGVSCEKVYARASENDTYILVFDKSGGVIVARINLSMGNWKMNPATLTDAQTLARNILTELGNVDLGTSKVMVFPPLCFLSPIAEILKGSQIKVGAQRISQYASGAFTGQISASQVKSLGAEFVLVGNSDCRYKLGDTDEMCAQQAEIALANGLTPVLCVGEPIDTYNAGWTARTAYIANQLKIVADVVDIASIVIVYEPIWSIGTGIVASAEQAQEMCEYIYGWLVDYRGAEVADSVNISYGGSITKNNATELMTKPNISGGLMGAVSLRYADFVDITKIIAQS